MNPSVNSESESTESPNPPEPQSLAELAASNQDETAAETVTEPDTGKGLTPREGLKHPISPPTEAIQYRAIGLIQGLYMPSAEEFNQGTLLAEDHTLIDAVLLGKVMNLVKKHLILSESHLWVVYPRTRKEDNKLHVQIVGVWEPGHLHTNQPPQDRASDRDDASAPVASPDEDITDGYFSIRGEVVYQSREEGNAIVKIIQAPRKKTEDKSKFFKLKLKCSLEDKIVGHFWDFQVQRQGDDLVIQEGKDIATLQKKKKSFKGKGKKPGGKKPNSFQSGGDNPATETPPIRSGPLPKPIKRPPESPE